MNRPRCAHSTRSRTTRLAMLLVAPKAGAMSRHGSGLCNTFIPSQMPCLYRRRSDIFKRASFSRPSGEWNDYDYDYDYDYEATCEAAMAAFAKSWRRE